MVLLTTGPEQAIPGLRQFVIVLASDADTIIDRFESPDWGPAITTYAERVRIGNYGELVSLREARFHERQTAIANASP